MTKLLSFYLQDFSIVTKHSFIFWQCPNPTLRRIVHLKSWKYNLNKIPMKSILFWLLMRISVVTWCGIRSSTTEVYLSVTFTCGQRILAGVRPSLVYWHWEYKLIWPLHINNTFFMLKHFTSNSIKANFDNFRHSYILFFS